MMLEKFLEDLVYIWRQKNKKDEPCFVIENIKKKKEKKKKR